MHSEHPGLFSRTYTVINYRLEGRFSEKISFEKEKPGCISFCIIGVTIEFRGEKATYVRQKNKLEYYCTGSLQVVVVYE